MGHQCWAIQTMTISNSETPLSEDIAAKQFKLKRMILFALHAEVASFLEFLSRAWSLVGKEFAA